MTSISLPGEDARDQRTETVEERNAGTSHLAAPDHELAGRLAATRLRNALRLNGEFSLITGLVAAVGAGPVASLLGVEQTWLVRTVGIGLLGFAISLFFIAGLRASVLRTEALLISLADFGWVVGTAIVIAASLVSTTGAVVMGLIALIVAELGIVQLRHRSQMTVGRDESPPVEIVSWRRSMPVDADRLWPVMTDHELYADLALNLSAAAAVTPNGPGLTRTCTDSAGRSWSETCTLWEAGRRFDIEVETDDYPYPLQLMEGSWAVEPAGSRSDPAGSPTGSIVSMTFAFQPEPGLEGRLFVPAMHLLFPPILARIGRGWRRRANAS